MLTLAEIESTMQIEYELKLEALGVPALRKLLADRAALCRLAPQHLDEAQLRAIAKATLAELLAREAPAPAAPATVPAAPAWPWAPLFTWFTVPPN